MKWDLDINNFMNQLEFEPECTTTSLVLKYYKTKGIDDITSVKDFIWGIANKDFPGYTTVYNNIRKWRRAQ